MNRLSEKRCVIIGSSPDTDSAVISANVKNGDFIICADGGYIYAQKAGLLPNLIIGDFDSADFPENAECEVITLPVKKDDTDTLFCVKEALKRGYDNIIILGGTGGRADHTFANICTLKFLAEKNIDAEIIGSDVKIFVMMHGLKYITGQKGMTFSVFPFGCDTCTVTLDGFMYELKAGILKSNFPIGVSNEIISDNARVELHEGTAVIMIEKIAEK